jgi:hypothetical protein
MRARWVKAAALRSRAGWLRTIARTPPSLGNSVAAHGLGLPHQGWGRPSVEDSWSSDLATIFFSYAGADREYLVLLTRALVSRGHTIWDLNSLDIGSDAKDLIEQAIGGADVVIPILSEASTTRAWVVHEIRTALTYASQSGRLLVLPVILKDAPLPADLASVAFILSDGQDVERVADDVSRMISDFIARRAAREQERREVQQRIEANAAEYVDEAVRAQTSAERKYGRLGALWYALGAVALVAGLFFAVRSLASAADPRGDWLTFAYSAVRAVLMVVLLGACARYAFTLGRSFTIESLKCADRMHAIAFGKFYLRVFNAEANWKEVKEAFANWNIDRPSAFAATNASDFDPKVIESITALAQVLKSLSEGKGSAEKADSK